MPIISSSNPNIAVAYRLAGTEVRPEKAQFKSVQNVSLQFNATQENSHGENSSTDKTILSKNLKNIRTGTQEQPIDRLALPDSPVGTDASDVNAMGILNRSHGVCGFTSTLYAVHLTRPELRKQLESALDAVNGSTRMMAEIKTFLAMIEVDGNDNMLCDIVELTRTFPGYETWSIDGYIADFNKLEVCDCSIALPPEAIVEYMRRLWDLRPTLSNEVMPGDAILGLTSSGASENRWKNLEH